MRGRTNITGGGMNLNATVDEFTVVDGQSVTSGDFVEFETVVSEKTLTSLKLSTKAHSKVTEDLCVVLHNNILYLISSGYNGLEIVDSYSDMLVRDYEILPDKSIVIGVQEEPFIIRLKITNEKFQYVCGATGIPSGEILSTDLNYLLVNGEKLYMFNIRTNVIDSSHYTYYFSIYTFDVSVSSRVSYISGNFDETIYEGLQRSSKSNFWKPVFVGENIYLLSEKASSKKFLNFQIIGGSLNIISNESVAAGTDVPLICFFDKYILSLSGYVLYIYNTKTGVSTQYTLPNFGFNISYNGLLYAEISEISEGRFAIFFYGGSPQKTYYQNGVFKLSESTGALELESNIFNPGFSSFSNSQIGVIFLNGIINDLMYVNNVTKSYAIEYKQGAGLLYDKTKEGFVKPYSGGIAIGVAKQSGKSGQKIEAYVPTPV